LKRTTWAWGLAIVGAVSLLAGLSSFLHVKLPWYGIFGLVGSGPIAAGGAALALIRPRARGAVVLGTVGALGWIATWIGIVTVAVVQTWPTVQARNAASRNVLPELRVDSANGFADLSFKLTAIEQYVSETQVLAKARRSNEVASFAVLLTGPWTEQNVADLTVWSGRVSFISVGEESHAFLRALHDAYGAKADSPRMYDRVNFTAMALEGDPRDVRKTPLKLKLFIEGVEDQYVEVFLNIDAGRSVVELAEKDPDYRKPLLKALTAQ
jgi:hypothetical protein